AHDLAGLRPYEMAINGDGIGGFEQGTIHPPGPPLGARFPVPWPAMRKELHGDGSTSDVFVGAYHAGDVVALSLTTEEQGDQGMLASVRVSFLLRQLERLGKLGEKALDALAKAAGVVLDGASSFAAKVERVASNIAGALLKLVNGALNIDLGGGHISWDLR